MTRCSHSFTSMTINIFFISIFEKFFVINFLSVFLFYFNLFVLLFSILKKFSQIIENSDIIVNVRIGTACYLFTLFIFHGKFIFIILVFLYILYISLNFFFIIISLSFI